MFFGGGVPDFLTEIGEGIDFVILDTVHSLPGEILDFLVLLPRLSREAVVVLHDISLNQMKREYSLSNATNVLLHSVRGKKILNSLSEDGPGGSDFPNIGAFQITEDTLPCAADVFLALTMRWRYMPSAGEMYKYEMLIRGAYDKELFWLYQNAVYMNAVNLYPVPQGLRRGMKVILYGAGSLGAAYWYQLRDFCHVIGWVDSYATDKNRCLWLKVKRPDEMDYDEAEVVVIAVKDKDVVAEIKAVLSRLGVAPQKIICGGGAN